MIEFPNISPEIFSFNVLGFELALRWYALAYILGFVCALYIMRAYLRRDHMWSRKVAPMEVDQADDLLTYLILGVILGGRIGYVLFYNLEFYLANPLDILRIWDGGMAFHGGFLGVVFALIYFCSRNSVQLMPMADLLALASPPGLLFGRVANFINAELWGRPTDVSWGVVFPGARAQDCPGVVGACARHPSQLYEAGLEGLALLIILICVAALGGLRRPGLLAGIFVAGYGAARYFVEFFRVPDAQFFSADNPYGFAYRLGDFGVTMGQTLSIPMILVGLLFIVSAMARGR
jgi:phosphatidylglycerol:prolipoprotein diacylglycerol transferase